MDRIIQLLGEKNEFLEQFYSLNESEMINFGEGNFDNLERFYNSREGLLNIIYKLDDMIEKSNDTPLDPENISSREKSHVIKALDYKNELVTQILSQDLQILSFIERAKSDIIKELSQVRATKKALGSYKSGQTTKTVDEEA